MDRQPAPSASESGRRARHLVRRVASARGVALAAWAARHARMWRSFGCVALSAAVMLWLGVPLLSVRAAPLGMPANASCGTLAAADHTATNTSQWGVTLMRGFGAPGGWFGVDVCGNGINQMSPGGANLSCDRVPANLGKTGCAPGHATYDGFGLSFQCVELITRFSAWAFGDVPWNWHGNAPDLWTAGNHPADFTAIANGSSQKPMPGDVLVWGAVDANGHPWPAGPQNAHDGHVAVVASVHGNQITTAEENVLWGQDNHPSDTLALAQSGGRWYIGATGTALPAFRWAVTMTSSRALYGWLHSSKNTGVFNGHGAVRGTPVPAPRPAATATPGGDTSGGVPSLAAGVVVTDGGTLADLVWVPDARATTSATGPHAATRGLGAPPGVRLAAGQTPAVITLPSGERDVYALGSDGQLYEARTLPQQIGVDWRALGAPGGVRLSGSVVTSAIPGALALGALGGDGQLWWRAGPSGNLGGWASAGRPSATPLQGTPVLAGTPGSGAPMALALGADGKLYVAEWSNNLAAGGAGQPAGWTPWQQVIFPASAGTLYAPLVPLFELPAQHATIGGWQDVAVDVVVRDGAGQLWWLRRSAGQPVWAPQAVNGGAPVTRLLGGVVVPPATMSTTTRSSAGVTVHLYAEGAQGAGEMARVQLDARGRPSQASWTAIQRAATAGATVSAIAASALVGSAAALALGPDLSGLIEASGQTVLLAGDQRAHGLLAPGATSAPTAPTSPTTLPATSTTTPSPAVPAAGQLWPVGVVVTADAFGDVFSGPALDPRWVQLVPGAPTLSVANGALALPPAPARAQIAQEALAQEVATVRIALPSGAAATVQAGLAYTLDDRDQLALAVARTGVVSFCATVAGQHAPCATQTLAAATVTSSVLLRIVNDGARFTAQVSGDGFSWQTVGSWSAPASPTTPANSATKAGATPAATSTTAPAAATATPITTPGWTHLTFTGVALFAEDTASSAAAATTAAAAAPTPDPRLWPTFSQFTVAA